jgi:hypothetical protein
MLAAVPAMPAAWSIFRMAGVGLNVLESHSVAPDRTKYILMMDKPRGSDMQTHPAVEVPAA